MEDMIFEETSVREYKGLTLKRMDPYGFIKIAGVDGHFTSYQAAEHFVDSMKNIVPVKKEKKAD